jgi:hypothetical protein
VPWHVARNEQLRLDEASSVERQLLAKLAADGAGGGRAQSMGCGCRCAMPFTRGGPCPRGRLVARAPQGHQGVDSGTVLTGWSAARWRQCGFKFYPPPLLQSINQQALSHNYGEPRFSIASAFANRVKGVEPPSLSGRVLSGKFMNRKPDLDSVDFRIIDVRLSARAE